MPRGQRVKQNDDTAEQKESRSYTRRSASEKAQADLDAAQKRVVKASDAYEEAKGKAEEARVEYERAVQLHDHASRHPDLPRADEPEAEPDGSYEELDEFEDVEA